MASEQSPDGSFVSPPAVSRDEEILQISSYDIAFALACLCLNELGRDERELSLLLLPCLARTFRLIQAMKEIVRPEQVPGHTLTGAALAENGNPETALDDLLLTERTYVGWPSDTSRFEQVVTGWSTARVLSLLVRYRDCLLAHRQQLVLSKYDVIPPGALSFPPYWYDFLPALSMEVNGLPSWVDDRLDSICDPTGDQRLTLALKKKLVGPVFRSPHRRPTNSSFLVSGPAGTRKTTLVRGIATSLEWPLLVLTPADFLGEKDVMGLHVIGSAIFKDLLRLRRVVVLLEECEELVHRLDVPEQMAQQDAADSRSQSDSPFLRAGMLPRLQALRDRRWVIFALSTMSDDVGSQLDQAVLREGRFDFHIVMDHPTIDAQRRYVRRELRRGYFSQIQEEDMELVPAYQSLVNKLETDQESIGDPITWSRLDTLIAQSGTPDTTSSDRTVPSNIFMRCDLIRQRSTRGLTTIT